MEPWRALPVAGRLFESARWLERERCFQWVDILSSQIFRWDPVTDALERHDLGFEFLTLATPSHASGVQFLASRDTVYTYRWGEEPEPFTVLPVVSEARLNDGILDAHGRLWIGSMGLAPDRENPLGRLWRIDAAGAVTQMLSGLGISNGIVWATQNTGFLVDSLAGALYAITDEGASLSRTTALTLSGPVVPDGILLAHGIVWLALWDGSAVGAFNPSTDQYSEVPVPATRPTSVAMSAELALITTAGRDDGNDLDRSGQVLVAPLGALPAHESALTPEDRSVAVAQADARD